MQVTTYKEKVHLQIWYNYCEIPTFEKLQESKANFDIVTLKPMKSVAQRKGKCLVARREENIYIYILSFKTFGRYVTC